MVDVLVVGAGPVGLCAALWAKRLGLSHLVLERGTVAETVYRFPRDMVFFSEAKNIEIGGHPLVAQGPKPTRKEALQMTGYVFAFVFVMALFMWITDKTLEWALYDLVLGWRS